MDSYGTTGPVGPGVLKIDSHTLKLVHDVNTVSNNNHLVMNIPIIDHINGPDVTRIEPNSIFESTKNYDDYSKSNIRITGFNNHAFDDDLKKD